jgi:hypothetical protein
MPADIETRNYDMLSAIKAAIEVSDITQRKSLLEEALRPHHLSNQALNDLLLESLSSRNFGNIGILLEGCVSVEALIPPNICSKIVHGLVNHWKWRESLLITKYMINRGYMFYDIYIIDIINGLLKSPDGITEALTLLALIAKNQREDLTKQFIFSKVWNESYARYNKK